MTRITNSLFESIRQVTNPVLDEAKVEGKAEDAGKVDAAHFCATHVEHSLYGEGECISEQHAKPNEDGTIDWYNVKFADGQVRKIQTEAVKVKKAKMHEHATPEGDAIEEKHLHPNQQVLDVHEPKKNKLTAKDFEMLRAGKKAKTVKKEKEIEEGMPGQMGHPGKVTMKQIAKSSAPEPVKNAIAKDASNIKTYRDRADALRAAGVPGAPGPRGTINASFEESVSETIVKQIDEIGDTPAGLEKVKAYRAAVGRQAHKTGEYDTRLSDKDRKPNPFHAKDAVANMPNSSNKRYNRQAGAARAKKIETGTRYEETNSAIEEAVSETIVKHNDFTIEITDNPTFGDFLRAVQSIVRTDEESMQQEIVAIAEQAFAENYEEVIIEAFTRMEIEDKIGAHRKAGNTVSNDKFSTKNGQPYAEYVVTDKEGGRKKYIHHGTVRRMESMSSVTKKDKE
jgi:hypothetical protein